MPPESAPNYRLRRFRVAIVAVVALPWVLRLVLLPFLGWRSSIGLTAFFLALDGALVFFACRNPSGLAPIWITLRLAGGAALAFAFGHGVSPFAAAVFQCAEAVLLVWLLAPMWRDLRREHLRNQMARVDALTAHPDRQARKRQAKIETRGYL